MSDLLGRMTTKEKIGQTIQFFGWKSRTKQGENIVVSEEFKRRLEKYQVGVYGIRLGRSAADIQLKATIKVLPFGFVPLSKMDLPKALSLREVHFS